MSTYLRLFVILTVLLVGTLTACDSQSGEDATVVPVVERETVIETVLVEVTAVPEPEPDADPIRYVNFRVYDPVYVAKDAGFFEANGCEVEIVGDVIAGPNAIQAVAGGAAEAGLSSIPAIINANAAGLPIIGVVDIQTTLEGQPLQKWYVRADSDIETLEDVVGRRYAVNIWRSSFHYTSLLALDEAGIDADSVDFQLLSFSDQIPALIEGAVDVIGLIQPYQAYLEDEFGDEIRELWNDYDLYGERHVSLIFLNRVWAKFNPEQAECFVTAIGEATAWIEDNQDAAREIVSEYTGIPAASVRDYHFTPYGHVRPGDVQVWLDYLLERGDVTADWLKVEEIANDKYNKAGE